MFSAKSLVAAVAAFLTVLSLQASSQSDDWMRKSVVELSEKAEVPGAVLEPGTYVLRLLDISDQRKIVQILNQDQSQTVVTLLAVPDHRSRGDSDGVLVFYDGVTSGPKAIRTWYWDNEPNGYEFIYSTGRAKELVKGAEDYVMAADSLEGPISAITPNGTKVPILNAMSKTEIRELQGAVESAQNAQSAK